MELWIGALNLGFLYAFMTMGVFITFRINDFPDITVDGSFTSGAAAAAVLLAGGYNPVISILAAFVVGAIAGGMTALIHTKLNINGLLAGILVMTGLYSINLHIMKRSNIPLLNQTTFLTYLEKINPGVPEEIFTALALCVVMAIFWLIVTLFFKTDLGVAMRATGNNPAMSAASGVNVHLMKIFGVGLANGLVGISGGLVAQYQGFADIGMGIGTILIGLASVIIGESVIRMRSMYAKVLSVIVGSVIFRFMIAFALYAGMDPMDLKLLTAIFVLLTLVVSTKLTGGERRKGEWTAWVRQILSRPKFQIGLAGIVALILAGIFVGPGEESSKPANPEKAHKIGVTIPAEVLTRATTLHGAKKAENGVSKHAQKEIDSPREPASARAVDDTQRKLALFRFSDHAVLLEVEKGIMDELERSGVLRKYNISVHRKSAQSDFAIAQSIAQDIVRQKYDYIMTISTPALQVTAQFNKKIPHVFGAVTDPYRMGVAKNPKEHQANVTGVATLQPVEATIRVMRELFPHAKRIGIVWNPAEASSEACTYKARDAVKQTGFELIEVSVSSTSEVMDAVNALINRGIDLFLTSGDNTVIQAFQPIVQKLRKHRIPYFTNNPPDVDLGSFVSIGADYYEVGQKTAGMAMRVINGEAPKTIPIYNFSPAKMFVNLALAKQYGIELSEGFLKRAAKVKQ